jgi:uncharacterized protein (DUF2252 family)
MPRNHAPLRTVADRQSLLVRTRRLKMARSAHAYVRGSTRQFYAWLAGTPAQVPEGPPVWICGDCHVGNLGPLADSKRRVAVQIRDLDQTVIGNPAHDLIRLGLSLASAVRGSDLPGVATARMLESLIAGYQEALTQPKDSKRLSRAPDGIQDLLAHSVRRRWPELAQERLKAEGGIIPLGKRFWPLESSEREALTSLFESIPTGLLLTHHQNLALDEPITLVDAAYWMKGCSSLGRVRYAALIRVGTGKHAPLGLVDIKAAVTAAAPRSPDADMPRDNAERVVAGARALSPNLGNRMLAARLGDQAVTLRELAPQDLKIEMARTNPVEAVCLARYLGEVVGRAHGRQLSKDQRQEWSDVLSRGATRSLDAPTWLWSSVVELLGLHEAAYLEHCRQYALAEAA